MLRSVTIRLLGLSVALVTVSTLPVFLTGAAFFEIGPELGIGPLSLGGLTAAFFLTASVTSPILGRWVQAVGWRRSMRINVATSAVLTVLIGVFASNVWVLGLLLMAAAAMYGASNPAANQALARHTDPARTGTVFGLKHAGIPASTLVAGLAVPAIVVRWGWRPAFVAAAALALAVGFLIPRGNEAEPRGQGDVRPARSRGDSLSMGEIRRLAVVAGLGAVAAVALGTFMVSAALDLGMAESSAGWLQFFGSAASILARFGSGVVTDRRGNGVLLALFSLLAIGGVVFALLSWATGSLFMLGVLVAYATGWGWPGLMTAAVVGSDREVAAATSSITQAGVFVGAGGSPLVLGLVVEHWSFSAMWLVVSVSLLAGAAMAWTVLVRRRHGSNG